MSKEAPTPNLNTAAWGGRFPKNDIITLLDVNRPFNLAESTSKDLTLGEVLDFDGVDELRNLKLGYGSAAGLRALRDAVGQICQVPPEHVLTTQGTALALFLLAFELCRPGDEIVLVTPCFPPSRNAFHGCGARIVDVPQSFDENYRLDMSRIKAALTSSTRLVSLASPGNPSGVRVSIDELAEVLEAMENLAPQALLFVDETYREAVYGDDATPHSAASLSPRIVVGGSISKAHGAPGLRVGWLIVSDPDLRERLTVAKMNIVISGSSLDEALAARLLQRQDELLAPRRTLLSDALLELEAWHAIEKSRLDWVRPDAGALCCLRLSRSLFDDAAVSQFWTRLADHDLQLAPGTWFGEEARVFRLGFGYLPANRLKPALAALSSLLDALLPLGGSHDSVRE